MNAFRVMGKPGFPSHPVPHTPPMGAMERGSGSVGWAFKGDWLTSGMPADPRAGGGQAGLKTLAIPGLETGHRITPIMPNPGGWLGKSRLSGQGPAG